MIATALAFKAEVVMGAHLVMRHRAPRIALLLSLLFLVLLLIREQFARAPVDQVSVVLLIAGTLAAVTGSRPLAPGSALVDAWRVAAQWWVVPLGRLVGVLIVVLPIVAIATLVFGAGAFGAHGIRLMLIASFYAGAVTALIMAITPRVGASAAALLGVVVAWLGALPPSAFHELLRPVPAGDPLIHALWSVAPIPSRAAAAFDEMTFLGVLLFAIWIVASTCFAAAVVTHPPPPALLRRRAS